jgi:hypothetical protein
LQPCRLSDCTFFGGDCCRTHRNGAYYYIGRLSARCGRDRLGSPGRCLGNPGRCLETQGAALETQGDASETQGDASETQGDASETQGDASETQGAASETQGAASETQGAALGSFVTAPSGRGQEMRNIKTYASCWCGHRGECATGYPNGRAIEQGRNSPIECNRVQRSAIGKRAESNIENQAGLGVARSGCVAISAVRCRQSGVGFPPRTLKWEEGGDSHLSGSTLASFRAGGGKS